MRTCTRCRWSTPVESGTYGGSDGDTVRIQQSASQGNGWDRDSIKPHYPTCLRLFIDKFVAARKRIGAEKCEFLFEAHTSKASKELKVVLLYLWRVNVYSRIFTWIKPRYNNIKKCTIIVDWPRQVHIYLFLMQPLQDPPYIVAP
jgi:hypothetical protein